MGRIGVDIAGRARTAVELAMNLKRATCPDEACGNIFTFAESCTGGMLASAVTGVPGASDVFPGSIVTYSNRAKAEIISVAPVTIEKYGAVSAQCAAEMAVSSMRLFGARMAVSVTGIAGPYGGSFEKPVGTVWFAIACESGGMRLKRGFYPGRLRAETQARSVLSALDMLAAGLEYELRKLTDDQI